MPKDADAIFDAAAAPAAARRALAAQGRRLRLSGGASLLATGGLCLIVLREVAAGRSDAVAAGAAVASLLSAAALFWLCAAALARAEAALGAHADDLALAERRARLAARLEQIDRRDALVGFVSHKLRTPLTTLGINLHRAGEAAAGAAEALRQSVERAERAAKKIEALIDDDFLAFGRVDLLGPLARVDMRAFLEEFVRRDKARAQGAAVIATFGSSAQAAIDPDALALALTDLLALLRLGAGHGDSLTLEGWAEDSRFVLTVEGASAPALAEQGAESLETGLIGRVVAAHGGTFAVAAPAAGRLRATVTLPLGDAPETTGEIS